MRLHQGGAEAPERARLKAWALVAVGYDDALCVAGLSDEDRSSLLRQRRCARELAQLDPRALAPSRHADALGLQT